ncbi:hypothetical protein CERSUDRAFT_73425 [Gelatoporia subvermispora B]|uniref:RRM domain-containing protein n=1 Tax=Ceriporiopsis subvermispora (strain B) TaxID=914234 RepID=M2QZE2_CERS8|nr:hypothetical protein CERSUDRAFT_73425 [Gelatoporia subvermispora B]
MSGSVSTVPVQQSAAPPTALAGASADAQAAAFAEDPRVHFDRNAGTWRFEDDDGSEMEWDAAKGTWVPVIDEDLLKKQQAAYSVAGVDEETPAAPVLKRTTKKRKEPEDYTGFTAGPSEPEAKRGKNGPSPAPERKSKNTAVYVTGLPSDTTPDELAARFSRCGLIEEDDTGAPKIKMYAREDGTFSGDALIVYFKEDSVDLALSILDDDELRLGESGTRMHVQRAQFGHKHEAGQGGGEMKPRRTMDDKRKATKRIGKMQRKLGEWDDEDGFGPSITEEDKRQQEARNSRVVVLKHMFTLKELEEDPSLLLDLKEDVREECETLGDVTNVVLYDQEPDGVMTVKFRDPLSAQACIIKMHGRFFAGRQIQASLYTGKQRFKRSGQGEELEGGGEENEKKRLDDFAHWLMTEGDD